MSCLWNYFPCFSVILFHCFLSWQFCNTIFCIEIGKYFRPLYSNAVEICIFKIVWKLSLLWLYWWYDHFCAISRHYSFFAQFQVIILLDFFMWINQFVSGFLIEGTGWVGKMSSRMRPRNCPYTRWPAIIELWTTILYILINPD